MLQPTARLQACSQEEALRAASKAEVAAAKELAGQHMDRVTIAIARQDRKQQRLIDKTKLRISKLQARKKYLRRELRKLDKKLELGMFMTDVTQR